MSEHDDRWLDLGPLDELDSFDALDGIWDGSLLPDDMPDWCLGLAATVEAATGPAILDELATEVEVVAAMHCLMRAASDPGAMQAGGGRGHRSPGVGRLVAAKIVVLVVVLALGATAAAATAGVVVPLLSPPRDERPRVEVTTTLPGTTAGTGDSADPTGGRARGDDDTRTTTSADADGDTTTPTTDPSTSSGANGNSNANGQGNGSANANGNDSTAGDQPAATDPATGTDTAPGGSGSHNPHPPAPADHGKKKGLSDAPSQAEIPTNTGDAALFGDASNGTAG